MGIVPERVDDHAEGSLLIVALYVLLYEDGYTARQAQRDTCGSRQMLQCLNYFLYQYSCQENFTT